MSYYHRREIQVGAFYNCGEQAVVVVAAINYFHEELYDWAAYIGIGTSRDEKEAAKEVAEKGCKLYSREAMFYFPQLSPEKYRR